MKCLIICSATSMSAMTPSRSGRIASIWSGVLPIISLASSPTALTCLTPLMVSIATTDGSLRTMPRSAHVDERVGGAEVDRHVVRRQFEKAGEVTSQSRRLLPVPRTERRSDIRSGAGLDPAHSIGPAHSGPPKTCGLSRNGHRFGARLALRMSIRRASPKPCQSHRRRRSGRTAGQRAEGTGRERDRRRRGRIAVALVDGGLEPDRGRPTTAAG